MIEARESRAFFVFNYRLLRIGFIVKVCVQSLRYTVQCKGRKKKGKGDIRLAQGPFLIRCIICIPR